jgi:hypothetical protein
VSTRKFPRRGGIWREVSEGEGMRYRMAGQSGEWRSLRVAHWGYEGSTAGEVEERESEERRREIRRKEPERRASSFAAEGAAAADWPRLACPSMLRVNKMQALQGGGLVGGGGGDGDA